MLIGFTSSCGQPASFVSKDHPDWDGNGPGEDDVVRDPNDIDDFPGNNDNDDNDNDNPDGNDSQDPDNNGDKDNDPNKKPDIIPNNPVPNDPDPNNPIKLSKIITVFFEDQIKPNPGTMFDISACITGDFAFTKSNRRIAVNKNTELDVTVYNAHGNACSHKIRIEQYRSGQMVGTPLTLSTSSNGTQASKKIPLIKGDELKVSWKSSHKQCDTKGNFISHQYSAADGNRPLPRFIFDACKGKQFPFN